MPNNEPVNVGTVDVAHVTTDTCAHNATAKRITNAIFIVSSSCVNFESPLAHSKTSLGFYNSRIQENI